MNILHITDFHYSNEPKNQAAQMRLVDSFINSLKDCNRKIDFVFFTGDLVFSGEEFTDFIEAQNLVIDRISKELNISKTNIMICPGNHDLYRGQELEGIKKIIGDLSNNDQIDEFVLKQDKNH